MNIDFQFKNGYTANESTLNIARTGRGYWCVVKVDVIMFSDCPLLGFQSEI